MSRLSPSSWRSLLTALVILAGLACLVVVLGAPFLPGARWLGEHTPVWVVGATVLLFALALIAIPATSWLFRRGWLRPGQKIWLIRAAVAVCLVGLPLTEVWVHHYLPVAGVVFWGALQLYVFWAVWREARSSRRR